MASKSITSSSPADVLVIGAGPAGLTCAAGIARLVHECIVFSTNVFRNRKSSHMHVVPTWDHRDSVDYRAATKRDILARYHTVSFEDASIESLARTEREDGSSLFKAVDETGKEWWGRKVVMATGITDVMPDIEGYEQCWVTGIFHCLFCHGYEERGSASAGVLAVDDCASVQVALHLARQANRLASRVIIYTNGDEKLGEKIRDVLSQCKPGSKSKANISVDGRRIVRLVKGPESAEVEVVLGTGERRQESFLVHKPKGKLNGNWVEPLGLEMTDKGQVKVTAPFNETSVSGLFAAGDCGTMIQSVSMASAMGAIAAAGVTMQLESED